MTTFRTLATFGMASFMLYHFVTHFVLAYVS